MAKKKAPRAVANNAWAGWDENVPAVPEVPFSENRPLMNDIRDAMFNQGGNDPQGMSRQMNDEFIQRLTATAANLPEPPAPVPPPEPSVGSESPHGAVQVPTPESILSQMPVQEKGSAGLAFNAQGQPVVGEDMPGVALSMPAIDFAGQAPEESAPKMAPYWENAKTHEDTRRAQHQGVRNAYLGQEEYQRQQDMLQGMKHAPLLDANGRPQYEQVPVLDERGRQALDEFGREMTRNGNPLYDMSTSTVDEAHPYQQSLANINQQKSSLDALLEHSNPQLDLSPLMAFAGMLSNHPELVKSYKIPPKYQETLEKVIGARKDIGAQQSKLFSDLTSAQKGLKDGSNTDLMSQILRDQLVQKEGAKSATNSLEDKMSLLESRQAHQNHRQVMKAIDNNPAQARLLGSYRTLGNALGILNHTGEILPAQIEEFQQQLRTAMGSALTGGGRSGVAERERSYAQTLGWNIDKLRSFLLEKPGNIMQDQATLNHLQKVAGREQQQLRQLYETGLNELSEGFPWQYDRDYPGFDEKMYGRFADGLEKKMAVARSLTGPVGSTQVRGGEAAGARELEDRITRPSKKIAVERRKSDAAAEKAAGNLTPRQKEIKKLREEIFNGSE